MTDRGDLSDLGPCDGCCDAHGMSDLNKHQLERKGPRGARGSFTLPSR
jgi:hypothetical protein